jgi:peptide/nickel transport system substrate-binding protein
MVAVRHARRRLGGRSGGKEPALKRSSIALIGLLAAAAVVAAPSAGAPEQQPRRGGTVVFGPVAESGCLNPFIDCGGSGPQYGWILDKVLPGAYALAPDFTRRPALVSGVTFTRTPPFTLTYAIRPAARWSDGVPVTARDFRFTYQALTKYAPSGDPHRTVIRDVSEVNAKTVRVVLRSRFAGWRSLFWLVLPRHVLAGEDLARIWTEGIENPKTGRPIGSGPFLVGGWDRGKQLTLRRNPNYWGLHKAYLDRLIVRFCDAACLAPPPAEVVESMRTGAVDVAYARDTEIAPDLRRIRGTTVRLHRTNGWEHLDFRVASGGHPALRNKLVRRAFAHSIDRAEIVRRIWGELDPTYRPLHSALFFNNDRNYVPNWAGYTYRPNLARSLLERAGCHRGADRIYSCGGKRLSFRFSTLPTRARERGLELMEPQLRRVGIEVVLSYGRGVFDQIFKGDFDVVSFAWINVDGFRHKDVYGCGGDQNYSGYCQRLVTADLDQADRILDDAQRARVLNRADRRLAKDVPVIPLYQIPWVVAYRDTIRNIVPSPDNLFWNAEDWWLDD